MQVDVDREVEAVTREVIAGEHDGKPTRIVIATRRYETDIDDAWDALTSAERIPRWFMPITGELKLGGRYQLQGNAGGTITECEPPRRLAATWEFGGAISWVLVTLHPEADGATRLRLEHSAPVDEEADKFWDQFGPGAVGVGWDLSLLGFARHVEQGETIGHEAGEAWAMTDEGKDFASRSSEGWRAASVAFGTEPEAARVAAARTTAFYTGAEAPDCPAES